MLNKMVTCKTCKKQIAKTARQCPYCGAKQHQGVLAVCYSITILMVIIVIAIIVDGFKGVPASGNVAPTASSQIAASASPAKKSVYSDKSISMSFVNVEDMQGLDGMFSININVKNETDKAITVSPENASVNGKMVQLLGGIEIAPHKEANYAYSGKSSTVEISKASEIKDIEFKICVMDESANVIETTESITIKP